MTEPIRFRWQACFTVLFLLGAAFLGHVLEHGTLPNRQTIADLTAPFVPPAPIVQPPWTCCGMPRCPTPLDYINRVQVQFSETQRISIVCPRLRDPERPKGLTGLRLFANRTPLAKPFALTCYIKCAVGQSVTLVLADGLELLPGEPATRLAPPANERGYTQVNWRVRALRAGSFVATAMAPGVGEASERVSINSSFCNFGD
jgi:hypothetical protein